ncbi:MAG: malate--CoA ligase subunit beta [Bauldia sp.]|nr:malate--CoA ligase subunit beta [Bauldia sp.]
MDIHEYQAKRILARYGVPVARGGVASLPEEAVAEAKEIGGDKWVVKAQVHSGARGKAGGVILCRTEEEVAAATRKLVGSRLVTIQTGPAGKPVGSVYVEAASTIDREVYLSFTYDRATQNVMVVASAAGGMDIEEVARTEPDRIKRVLVDPAVGLRPFHARAIALSLGLGKAQLGPAAHAIHACYRAFWEADATMIEINPLAITTEGKALALDAKISLDENALYRHGDLAELRDPTQEDPRETFASDKGLAYVGLDGTIGCIINGAGLAMATLDMIKLAGGEPANFLDIGGAASPERVATSFRAVLQDPKVEAILVNIFAGINRCDWIAEGVIKALNEVSVKVPLVVRLAGTNVDEGMAILSRAEHPIIIADSLADAATKAVAASRAMAPAE